MHLWNSLQWLRYKLFFVPKNKTNFYVLFAVIDTFWSCFKCLTRDWQKSC
jgi:hypothetical protein